ncbi:MAG: hypothetical protein LBK50_03580 [Candidatus Nomurabacteria bacterium]|jgi:hypothetical protein|nr:hypothetical protein [Candidatus Nomurabacteria bacterium]
MDNTTTTPKPADDQELANLLAGLGDKTAPTGPAPAAPAAPAPKPEPKPMPTPAPAPNPSPAPAPVAPTAKPEPPKPADNKPALRPEPAKPDPKKPAPTGEVGDLEGIKNKALDELRPLAERINLPPAEKFDTLLLMIRTTDDKGLIKYAHEIAKQIEDKDKQAQALLDIVKEVDFFTHK